MICRGSNYETERTNAKEWHSFSWDDDKLAGIVAAVITEPVARELPDAWQGDYTTARARSWIRERDEEGPTLLVVDKDSGHPVGLVILFELDDEQCPGGTEVRLGYLLSERAWGKGLATEIVRGFVDWCRGQPAISSLGAGATADNPASIRVLEKCGFRPVSADHDTPGTERFYALSVH